MFKEEKEVSKGLGMIETANTLGKVLSPILGASLALIVWYMPFVAIPIFCLISIIALCLLVKEPKMKEKPLKFKAFIKSVIVIFKREGRWLYAVFIIGGICMFVLFGVLFYLSDLLEKTHQIDGIKKGIILAIPLAALCCASFATGKVIGQDKKKMKRMTTFGISLIIVALFSMSFSKDIYLLLTALLVSGIGIGIALPSLDAFVTEGVEMAQRGSITSLYSSMRFLGVALGPPVFSLLMKTTHVFTFLLNTGLCIIALVVTLLMIKPEQKIKVTWD